MKSFKAAFPFIFIALLFAGLQIGSAVMAEYRFERDYLNEWHLADKSSTIIAKQQHVAKFQKLLESGVGSGEFSDFNAFFLKTANNSIGANLAALNTLSKRLAEIQEMDPTSFQYNTAIQQITQQEQGEAGAMIQVFEGCYTKRNYIMAWGWVACTLAITELLLLIFGIVRWIYVADFQ